MTARSADEYLTDRLTDEAVAFIERNRARPFFAYLPHYAVHIPLQAKPGILARYKAKPVGASTQSNPIYAAMLESLDEGVGRILKTLDELEIADRTVIVFTSDNGGLSVKEGPNTPATSNAPLRAGKGYLYEGGIRVPLIVRWPGKTRHGSVCEVPVSGQDLYPTVLDIAGVKPAPGQVIDGESLVPLLKGQGGLKRTALFWHYPHYSNQGGKPGGAVRQGDLKLIEYYEDGRRELYDLERTLASGTTSPPSGLVTRPGSATCWTTGDSRSGARCPGRTRIIRLASGIDSSRKVEAPFAMAGASRVSTRSLALADESRLHDYDR